MPPLVRNQVRLCRERLGAKAAREWPLAGVLLLMPDQLGSLGEGHRAVAALVGPLARVEPPVLHQAVPFSVRLVTVVAPEWAFTCVRPLVGHQLAAVREGLGAQRAPKCARCGLPLRRLLRVDPGQRKLNWVLWQLYMQLCRIDRARPCPSRLHRH